MLFFTKKQIPKLKDKAEIHWATMLDNGALSVPCPALSSLELSFQSKSLLDCVPEHARQHQSTQNAGGMRAYTGCWIKNKLLNRVETISPESLLCNPREQTIE